MHICLDFMHIEHKILKIIIYSKYFFVYISQKLPDMKYFLHFCRFIIIILSILQDVRFAAIFTHAAVLPS